MRRDFESEKHCVMNPNINAASHTGFMNQGPQENHLDGNI